MITAKLWEKEYPLYDESITNEDNKGTNKIVFYPANVSEKAPTVVIYPGGGYCIRAEDHEGDQIAKFYNLCGYNAAVVSYRVKPYRHPAQLLDAQRAIKIVRYNADEWNVDTNRVFTLGFSAGGHLCGMTATLPDICTVVGDDVDKMSAKPNGAILCYAVCSSNEEIGHLGSFESLLGKENMDKKDLFSNDKNVDQNTCPCFLWHTAEDDAVNVKNTLLFTARLAENGIPVETHIFPKGRHGLGPALEVKGACQWLELSAKWIKDNF